MIELSLSSYLGTLNEIIFLIIIVVFQRVFSEKLSEVQYATLAAQQIKSLLRFLLIDCVWLLQGQMLNSLK